MNKSPIGIFDSGFGGLTIMREIIKKLPDYDYLYLGDNARAPYGSRSSKIVYRFTEQAIEFLFKKNCKLIILACNTASSDALFKIQKEFLPANYPDKKVLGIIIPTVEKAIDTSKNSRFGVLATEGTVSSKTFVTEFKKKKPLATVFQKACPLLVPIVECGETHSLFVDSVIKKYIKPLIKRRIDTLILGCTHYALLEKKIRKVTPKEIKIIHQGKTVAFKLENYLKNHTEIEKKITRGKDRKFFTTDLTSKFKVLGSKFFGQKINPEKVDIE